MAEKQELQFRVHLSGASVLVWAEDKTKARKAGQAHYDLCYTEFCGARKVSRVEATGKSRKGNTNG